MCMGLGQLRERSREDEAWKNVSQSGKLLERGFGAVSAVKTRQSRQVTQHGAAVGSYSSIGVPGNDVPPRDDSILGWQRFMVQ